MEQWRLSTLRLLLEGVGHKHDVRKNSTNMSAEFSSISPIDDSVVWAGRAASAEQIDSTMQVANVTARQWSASSLQDRIDVVGRYGEYLSQHRDQISELITREVGKLTWDARGEVAAAIAKVELSIDAIRQRRDTQLIQQDQQTVGRVIRFRPLGVVLVLGPFNFPLHLPGGQIIPALLAGNTVVFKPSQQATAVGQWMLQAWQQVGLPRGVLQMITGGVETAVTAIDSPCVNGVFLTGSRAAGRAIGRQLGGRTDVLLALELGGNNPIVVTDVDPAAAASVVSLSAFVSAGQRCTCARRAIFVESELTASQIDALVDRTRSLRVGLPLDDPAVQVGPLISESAAHGLGETYERLLRLGCRALEPMVTDSRRGNLVRPAIVDATPLTEQQREELGEMEWFGPLLVIERVADFETAIQSAARTPYGLAASLLGGTRSMFDRFVGRVGAGVVNWNRPTTGAAGSLPFGGLGDSGNHRPAGFYAIDFCNDPVASLESESLPDGDSWSIAR
jgi:succinylglutamic semialdehyde dehydrogenase